MPIAVTVWAVALVLDVRHDGVPVSRDKVLLRVFTLLLAVGLDRPRRLARSLPLAVFLLAYDVMRGRVGDLVSRAHTEPAIAFDRFVFGGTLPTVWLQHHPWQGTPSCLHAGVRR